MGPDIFMAWIAAGARFFHFPFNFFGYGTSRADMPEHRLIRAEALGCRPGEEFFRQTQTSGQLVTS
jgi:hypothetical protein